MKKQMKQRAVSCLIVLAILCGLLSTSILPASAGGWMEDFTWDEATATLTIHTMDDPYGYLSGANAMWYVENNAIPYFDYRDLAEHIVIGSGVEKVLPYSLYGFKNARTVTIEEGATEICYAAFANCSALETASIADSVTCLRGDAFFACEKLNGIRISEYVDCLERPFGACTGLNELVIDANNPSYTFQNGAICNKSGTRIIQCLAANRGAYPIADGVEVIGSDAFRTCASLTAIEFPHSVTTIEERAFYGCDGLTEIILPESVTAIGDRAFANCSNLYNITLRNSSCVINGTEALGPAGSTYVYGFVGSTAESYAKLHGYNFIDIENPVLPQYSGTCGENVTWEYDKESKTLHISGNGAMSNYFVMAGFLSNSSPAPWLTVESEAGVTSMRTKFDIQSVVIHPGVTHLGRWAFSWLYSVTSVEIPDSVTSIGDGAFCGCMSIGNITLPNSLMNIGMEAFMHCEKLQAINIPASVTEIGSSAFSYCDGLSAISVDEGNPVYSNDALGVLFNKDKTELVCVPAGAIDGAYTIPSTVTIIGDEALKGCRGISDVTIPTGVTRIGIGAFASCTNLLDVTIPESVTSIGNSAFSNSGCEDNADNWENGAFFLDHWLLDVSAELPAEYTVPEGTVGIADYVFLYCDVLTDVAIPGSVKSIGECVFCGCGNLQSVTIGDGMTSIGWGAFYECSSLTSVTIPDSVTSIGEYAFYECSSLTSVTIPDSVTSIGDSAFSDCGSLTAIDVAAGNTKYSSADGILFNKDQSILVTYPAGKTETEYRIPESVTSIGDDAFSGCGSLTSVTIPNSVTSIGWNAFSDCYSLTSVTIGNSVTSIGDAAFFNCSSLKSVTIPNSVTSIGISALRGCSSLTSVTIGNSVTNIEKLAFLNCNSLTSVYFEGNAPEIGESVFQMWDAEAQESVNIPNLTLYYIEGKAGWTTPTWNGYPTAAWMPVHEHVYAETVTAPTCTGKGYTTHTCTNCGDSYADTYVDALGHDYCCTETVKPTADSQGYDVYTCTRCGDSYRDNYVDAVTQTTDALKFKRASLTLESDISINFYVLDSVLKSWDDPYVVFTKAVYDETGSITGYETETVTDFTSKAIEDGSGCHVFTFTGIYATEMGSAVTATLYASKDGAVYEGRTVNYSVLQYVTNMLNKSTDAGLRTMLVDLLNYGAAAQSYYGYNAASPVNANLTAEQQSYATQENPTLSTCRELIQNEGATVSFKSCTLYMKEKVSINYYLNLSNYAGAVDDLCVKVSYTDENGKAWTQTIDSSELLYKEYNGSYYYVANFSALNAMQMRTECKAEVFSKATGERISNTLLYSIESFAYSKADDPDTGLAGLVNAMMKYGNAVEAYFLP